MLKFRVTNGNRGIDVKTLEITDMELQDFTTYDVPDGYYNVVTELNDEVTYKFWVKDLFTIQEDSHLTSISNIPIVTEYGGEAKEYKYVADVVVTSVSKADKCLTLNVKKEMELNIDKLYIETRYNAIMFVNNRWEMSKVTQEWLTEQPKEKLYGPIKTDESPYGENRIGTLTDEDTVSSNNTAFYYENDSWKEIDLIGDDLERCLNGNKINFGSIHLYDKSNRKAIKMDEDKIYYTCENYIILDFYPSHYFGVPYIQYKKEDMDGVMEMIEYTEDGKEIINSIDYPVVYLYFEKIDGNVGIPQIVKLKKEVHVEDEKRLIFNFDSMNGEDISLIKDKMFPYGYEIDAITNEVRLQEGMVGGFTFTRNNIMYDERYCSYSLVYDFAVNTVKIPISQKFENDLFHNDMVQKNFVDKAIANSINPIIDMEKDVYTPAIQKTVGEQVNAEYDDCFKIIFNLHFLKHRDTMKNGQKEEWTCDRDSYWNGTRVLEKEYVVDDYETDEKYKKEMKKVVDLMGRVYNYDIEHGEISKVDKYDYFSYYGEKPNEQPSARKDDGFDNPNKEESNDYNIEKYEIYKDLRDKRVKLTEYQSDLLSYLGFDDDDVKYQKSKLKKSFLRISFYDSDNIANQNLLHTATIFLDSGELFAKYIKNIETEDEYKATKTVIAQKNPEISFKAGSILTSSEYEKLDDDNRKKCVISGELLAANGGSSSDKEGYTMYDKVGMSVNREPMRKRALDKSLDFGDNIDELERLRMSSQIVVTDKNSSKRSSEGFYFYTYKSNDNGVYPSDIYMRVEFNHAGYGRVIPFMMPYIRKSEEKLKENSPGYERYTETSRDDKIKTFDDICYDWSEIDIDKGIKNEHLKDDSDIGYSAVRYMKYCHIKWKYRYDKHTQKHIYYLDPDVYGKGVTSENNHGNNIILNLYEGKIR